MLPYLDNGDSLCYDFLASEPIAIWEIRRRFWESVSFFQASDFLFLSLR